MTSVRGEGAGLNAGAPLDLRGVVRVLGGAALGLDLVSVPWASGSLHVRLDPAAPGGFVVRTLRPADDQAAAERYITACLAGRRPPQPLRPRPAPEPDNSAVAGMLWRRSVPIAGTPGARYLREVRGIQTEPPATMRFLPPRLPHAAAIVTAAGIPWEPEPELLDVDGLDVRAAHLIRLAPDGTKLGKIMLGAVSGRPFVLAPFREDGRGLCLAEGIEDGLSLHEATGLPVWAGGSASHLAALAGAVPAHVETVAILQDDDPAGRNASGRLAEALSARGFEVVLWAGGGT